jgi:hypothetical protein
MAFTEKAGHPGKLCLLFPSIASLPRHLQCCIESIVMPSFGISHKNAPSDNFKESVLYPERRLTTLWERQRSKTTGMSYLTLRHLPCSILMEKSDTRRWFPVCTFHTVFLRRGIYLRHATIDFSAPTGHMHTEKIPLSSLMMKIRLKSCPCLGPCH